MPDEKEAPKPADSELPPPAGEEPAKDADEKSAIDPNDPLKILGSYYRKQTFYAAWILIAINCLIFLAMLVESKGASFIYASRNQLINWGACAPSLALNEEPWRLLSYAFVHAGIIHLAVNMFVLWDVGRYVERLGGALRFLTIYLFCAVGAAVFGLLAHPYQVSAGASGAVLGLWGAFLSFFINNQSTLPKRLIIATMRFVPIFVFIAVVWGMFTPDVDNAAHAGGFIVGMFCGIFLLRPANRPVKVAWTVSSFMAMAGLLFTLYRVDQMRPFDFEHQYERDRAMDLIKRHDPAQALIMINKNIASNPNAVDGYLTRLYILERKEDWHGAESDATKILELGGPKAVAYSLRAQARLHEGDYQNALADAEAAIKLAPTLPRPYTVRIQAKEWLGLYDQALNDATIGSSPPLSEGILQRLRGEIYWQRGDYDKATDKFDTAVKTGEIPEIALSTRAQFFLSRHDYLLAARDAEKVLSLGGADNPQAAYTALLAVMAYRGSGQPDKAQEVLRRVRPHVTDEWQKKLLEFAAGDLKPEELLSAARDNDDKTEANTYVAIAYVIEGKEKEARPLLEWVVEHGNKAFTEYPQAKTLLRDMQGAPN